MWWIRKLQIQGFFFPLKIYLRTRGRVQVYMLVSQGEGHREKERERQNLKQTLHWAQPDMGLSLMTLKSWPEPKSRGKHSTNWLTQVPPSIVLIGVDFSSLRRTWTMACWARGEGSLMRSQEKHHERSYFIWTLKSFSVGSRHSVYVSRMDISMVLGTQ